LNDTHAHLDTLSPEVLQETLRDTQGFALLLSVASRIDDLQTTLTLAETYPWIYAAIGLHPVEAERLAELERLAALSSHPRVRALGESGLDLYWHPETEALQWKALEAQALLAAQANLPLVLHIRSAPGSDQAERAMARWIREAPPLRLVLHAFSGHYELLEAGLERDAYFSFAGPLTYKRNESLRQAARLVPLERILIETDSPFLPPEPFRGQVNRPSWVRQTLDRLAELRQLSPEEAEAAVDANARRCFRLTEGPSAS
jgi:TatD DNase family protein